jgi:plasmid stabilization system protein ParE
MSFRVFQDSGATFEFLNAVARYEAETDGLGIRFTLEVDRVINAISSQPFRFSKAGRKGRKARVLGWPYTIYFVVNETEREIKVVAVWHGARNPAELQRRLK